MGKHLLIPPSAETDPNSVELLRLWAAHEGQHVSIQAGAYEDPFAWGIVLADLARHIAVAYEQDKGLDKTKTLEIIRAGLLAELCDPTDEPTGRLLGGSPQ